MRNLKLTLAYDGSEFFGWQVQPGRPTVQGTLAEAIARITGEPVLPQGSGRTDTGVHALAQVASFAIESVIPAGNLRTALNDVLPATIRILNVTEVGVGFHARKSARGKTYRYRIFRGEVCPPVLARYVFPYPYPLNENAMMAAAAQVEGEHDFTSFAAVDPERNGAQVACGEAGPERSNLRTILASQWEICPAWNPAETAASAEGEPARELVYTVRGSGFLHHMVRNLVGCFLLIGRNKLTGGDLNEILKARNRSMNPGATAPACGLYLVSVDY
jgi:tRNA pseudouridine38-40 synthase